MRTKPGFSLVELSLVMVVMGILALAAIGPAKQKEQIIRAHAMGMELRAYNAAVSRFLIYYAGRTPTGVYQGSSWLQGSDCKGGTAEISFLPCYYLPSNKTSYFGLDIRTEISKQSDGFLAKTTLINPRYADDYKVDGLAMAVASKVASGVSTLVGANEAIGSGFSYFCSSAMRYEGQMEEICDGVDNTVVMMTSSLELGMEDTKMITRGLEGLSRSSPERESDDYWLQ